MLEKHQEQLRELAKHLREVGSGLDCVDKTGSWAHYDQHKKKAEDIIATLPPDLRQKVQSEPIGPISWNHIRSKVLFMIQDKPQKQ